MIRKTFKTRTTWTKLVIALVIICSVFSFSALAQTNPEAQLDAEAVSASRRWAAYKPWEDLKMIGRYFCRAIAITSLVVLASITTFAQVSQFSGQVFMEGTDGQKVTLDGARVDVFRTDERGKYETKTDKRGIFVFGGLPYKGIYIVAVSHPRATPNWIRDVRLTERDTVEITLKPGDGKRLTYEDIQAADGKSTAPKDSPKTETPRQTETPKKEVETPENDEDADETETVKIYVGDLSPETTEETLREAFEEFGEVKSVKLERDASGKSKGFGYVEMAADEAEEAISELNGSELNGKKIQVKKVK